ncbi:GatB/YqeY domain-containing protein [Saccharophagus sp. K07]|uniref:GatB/YqeY domain-containing protein n=1 Tax=Saccharophagus sp. K07 TaxID=2283636 RepID=UPI001652A313|nr:GatB/YqeY domain-containing protein [Saccharophagus sp. K07]MBC6903912.1 GatB/YqeY domain-containing protein [Saccharophagus sp. K07]
MSSAIQQAINEAVKDAMRAKAKERLSTLRLITAEFKRIEVDERIELDDARVLAVLDKMVKQRRESAKQYNDNGRPELAEQELFEISVIQEYLPQQLSEEEIRALVQEAATGLGVSGMADMGKLMAAVKPKVQGRADMGLVSQIVKAQLQ